MFKPYMLFVVLSMLMTSAFSAPQKIQGQWLDVTQTPIAKPLNIGGQYSFSGIIDIDQTDVYVIDFAQGSLYESFSWQLIDKADNIVASAVGGVGDSTANEFPLRHGRNARLVAGDYRFELNFFTTHLIINPVPYIQPIDEYHSEIFVGNVLTIFCLGIFFSLIFYYLFMYFFRKSKADLYYALFILGNFLFQGTALLFFKDLFGLHWFLLSASPILFSNIFYILFVSELLSLKVNSPRLYNASRWILATLASLALIALFNPHYMMEFNRLGVGVFCVFGMLCGVVLAVRKNRVALWYLAANAVFTLLALFSILVTDISGTFSFYAEHIGLIAVATESLLLTMVMSYQVGELQKNERSSLVQMKRALNIASSDALTGVLNRRAFDNDFNAIGVQDELFIIDIDGLKILNDQQGHYRGDELLLRFCEIASINLSLYCSFYRIGGDEFAVISRSLSGDYVKQAIDKTIEQLNQEGFPNIGASIGSALAHEGENLVDVFKLADTRMYENKQRNNLDVNIIQTVTS